MPSWEDYRGMQVPDAATGDAGIALKDNFEELADRAGKSNFAATSDPGTGDDVNDGYYPGSRWLNTTTFKMWVCVANIASAAVWVPLFRWSSGDVVVDENLGIGGSLSARLGVTIDAAGTKGEIIKAAASQTANLQEWQDSSADAMLAVTKEGALDFKEQGSDPATPASGDWRFYAKSDGLYVKDDAGTVTGATGDLLSKLSNGEVSITGTTTLTSSAFGKMHACTGSSAYTITLLAASGNAGKSIGFRFRPTSDAIITVDGNGSTLGDTTQSRKYIAGEVLILYCNGTNWDVISEELELSYMTAGMATAQTTPYQAPDQTWTKIRWDNPSTDTHGWWDSTNKRYTPKAPGLYSVKTSSGITVSDQKIVYISAYKNGSGFGAANQTCSRASNATVRPIITCDIPMNGSTDYIEVFHWHDYGSARDIEGSFLNITRLPNQT